MSKENRNRGVKMEGKISKKRGFEHRKLAASSFLVYYLEVDQIFSCS